MSGTTAWVVGGVVVAGLCVGVVYLLNHLGRFKS